MAIELCRRCKKPRTIFREGFCHDCYVNKVEKIYVLKPYTKYRANMPEALIKEIAENPHFDKKEIVLRYGISRQRLYQILAKYFDPVYVDKEKATLDIPGVIK